MAIVNGILDMLWLDYFFKRKLDLSLNL